MAIRQAFLSCSRPIQKYSRVKGNARYECCIKIYDESANIALQGV